MGALWYATPVENVWIVALLLVSVGAAFLLGRNHSTARVDNGPLTETTSAATPSERLAAILDGEDDPEGTIPERLDALALGLKNQNHRLNMLQGRMNTFSPPAEKGRKEPATAGDGAGRPLSRADIYRRHQERLNAR